MNVMNWAKRWWGKRYQGDWYDLDELVIPFRGTFDAQRVRKALEPKLGARGMRTIRNNGNGTLSVELITMIGD